MNIDPSQIRTMVRIVTQRTGAPVYDEDLEQEAALRAIQAFRKTDVVSHPRAFLMKIVQDAVRDHWRRRRSSADLDSIDERFLSESPAFEDALDRAHRRELLQEALARLSSVKRTLIELFYERDYSIPEIARLQNRSISAIKMELLRARRELAQIMEPDVKPAVSERRTRR